MRALKTRKPVAVICSFLLLISSVAFATPGVAQNENEDWQELEVTASAYTLAQDETKQGNVGLAAWGDMITPDMKVIAVSRDLIKQQNIGHRTRVKIEGLPGVYHVRDKMHRRWRNKIDILVPTKSQAFEWGKRTVKIRWLPDV